MTNIIIAVFILMSVSMYEMANHPREEDKNDHFILDDFEYIDSLSKKKEDE